MFILGSCMGSFLALIIYRLPKDLSIWPRSYCESCRAPIKAWHNIPIFSWIFLRAKCAYCSSPIKMRTFFIEILCGVCLLALYLKFGFSFGVLEKFGFFFILVAISYIDMDYFSIPYSLILALFLWGIISTTYYYFYPFHEVINDNFGLFSVLVFPKASPFFDRLLGAFVAVVFFASLNVLISFILRASGRLKPGQWAMGWGDPLLASGIGLFVGLSHLALVIFLASFMGSICGLIFKILGKNKAMDDIPAGAVPFGPFLSMAAIYAYLF